MRASFFAAALLVCSSMIGTSAHSRKAKGAAGADDMEPCCDGAECSRSNQFCCRQEASDHSIVKCMCRPNVGKCTVGQFKHYKAADWKDEKIGLSDDHPDACCEDTLCSASKKMCFKSSSTECKCISNAKSIPKGMARHKEGDFKKDED